MDIGELEQETEKCLAQRELNTNLQQIDGGHVNTDE